MVDHHARAPKLGCPSMRTFRFGQQAFKAYLENGGTVENAQAIAAHERPRTTRPFDRRRD